MVTDKVENLRFTPQFQTHTEIWQCKKTKTPQTVSSCGVFVLPEQARERGYDKPFD